MARESFILITHNVFSDSQIIKFRASWSLLIFDVESFSVEIHFASLPIYFQLNDPYYPYFIVYIWVQFKARFLMTTYFFAKFCGHNGAHAR